MANEPPVPQEGISRSEDFSACVWLLHAGDCPHDANQRCLAEILQVLMNATFLALDLQTDGVWSAFSKIIQTAVDSHLKPHSREGCSFQVTAKDCKDVKDNLAWSLDT